MLPLNLTVGRNAPSFPIGEAQSIVGQAPLLDQNTFSKEVPKSLCQSSPSSSWAHQETMRSAAQSEANHLVAQAQAKQIEGDLPNVLFQRILPPKHGVNQVLFAYFKCSIMPS